MRDRLIELLKQAEKQQSLNAVCGDIDSLIDSPKGAEFIADYLLANGVIVPPCKVGDKVYHIKGKTIFVMSVKWFETNNYGWCACCVYPPMATFVFKFSDFGKTVFLTREEAERTR